VKIKLGIYTLNPIFYKLSSAENNQLSSDARLIYNP
jgi:hypothetical protein